MTEQAAFRRLFQEHAPYIVRSLRYLGVRDADVEDLCQEVFIVAHRKLPEFEGRSTVRTWLYGICIRTASDYRRRAYVRRERTAGDVPSAAERELAQDFRDSSESRATLQALLERLDVDKREVLVLYELEGFTMKEVAEVVGCPLQTAYSRLYAAREQLMNSVRAATPEAADG